MLHDLESELLRVAARLPGTFTLPMLRDELARAHARLAHPLLEDAVDALLARLVAHGALVSSPEGYTLTQPAWAELQRPTAILYDNTPVLPRDDRGLGLVERAWSYMQRE